MVPLHRGSRLMQINSGTDGRAIPRSPPVRCGSGDRQRHHAVVPADEGTPEANAERVAVPTRTLCGWRTRRARLGGRWAGGPVAGHSPISVSPPGTLAEPESRIRSARSVRESAFSMHSS